LLDIALPDDFNHFFLQCSHSNVTDNPNTCNIISKKPMSLNLEKLALATY